MDAPLNVGGVGGVTLYQSEGRPPTPTLPLGRSYMVVRKWWSLASQKLVVSDINLHFASKEPASLAKLRTESACRHDTKLQTLSTCRHAPNFELGAMADHSN